MVTSSGILKTGLMLLALTYISACSSAEDDPLLLSGDVPVAYIKRPVSDSGGTPQYGDPIASATYAPGGHLYIRDKNSAKAVTYRITGKLLKNSGDVSDLEVSYDGKKIIFSLRCDAARDLVNCSDSWDIWEYDMTFGGIAGGNLRRVTARSQYDDIDPAYLPDGQIVFSSNEQNRSRIIMDNIGVLPFSQTNESGQTAASVLHVMDANGANIEQISFNRSNDRNPTVLSTGEIMFSRWDNVGGRSQLSIYKVNPDGSGMNILYGAHTDGPIPQGSLIPATVCYLNPRETQNGRILSTVMPLTGTYEGGALALINPNGDDNSHSYPTYQTVPLDNSYAAFGRYNTPFPVWDGSGRALVSFTPAQTQNSSTGLVNGPAAYRVNLLNLGNQTSVTQVLPDFSSDGVTPLSMVIDAIPVMSRPFPSGSPSSITTNPADPLLTAPNQLGGVGGNQGEGILNIKSVYYTDAQGRMDDEALVLGLDFLSSFPSAPRFVTRNPDMTINIDVLKSPMVANSVYRERPARFIRVTRAVPTPPGLNRAVIGATLFEMQEILGYSVVEPDGSARIRVPADVPFGLSVVDAEGRAFQIHTNWLQVRPGETVQCQGCHASRSTSYTPATVFPVSGQAPDETMAEARYPTGSALVRDLVFNDFWSNLYGVADDPAINIAYTGTPTPVINDNNYERIVINYGDHIQPIWDANCVGCHNGSGSPVLDLTSSSSVASGRYISYDQLLLGNAGRAARVNVGDAMGGSRASYLTEVLLNRKLRGNLGRLLPSTDHSGSLSPSEARVVYEWMDIGGQYFNDPFIDGAGNDGEKDFNTELRN